MNNRIEQDHRGVKDWTRNRRGFKNIFSALISLTIFEEIRQHFKLQGNTRAQRRGLLQQFEHIVLAIA